MTLKKGDTVAYPEPSGGARYGTVESSDGAVARVRWHYPFHGVDSMPVLRLRRITGR